ncbi:MAG TPA: aldo/keto reductase [Dehalococcoidales bacterium]|nr:aldo/keto reductase [Dehalococcoidales bacterium]
MKTIRLGRTNIRVPQLGFGGIPIQRLNESDAVKVVERCLDLGVVYLDTANGYSTSEERIGKAIKGRRDKVVLATKTAPINKEIIEKNLKLSLTRLGVDYIDIYQIHGVSTMSALESVLSPGGALDVFREAQKAGYIRHIGITSHQIDVAKKAVESNQFSTLMFPFNFMATEAADILLPICRQLDIGFISMKPLAGGMVDNAAVCFKYLASFDDVLLIPGIEKTWEIEEIHQIMEGPLTLTADEKKEMERIKQELGPHFCHRCDYCQPCTAGIPISMMTSVKSFYKRLPPERFFGEMVGPMMTKAASCTQCGKCEERCPYHLPIRQMISEQLEWFNQEKTRWEAKTRT